MSKYNKISMDEWEKRFKPVINHIDTKASFVGFCEADPERGCMFETYGADLQYIRDVMDGKIPGLSEMNVWTLMDGESPDEDSPEGVCLKAAGWSYDEDEGWMRGDESLDTNVIGNGYHHVNRIGYFITSVPVESGLVVEVVDDALIVKEEVPA